MLQDRSKMLHNILDQMGVVVENTEVRIIQCNQKDFAAKQSFTQHFHLFPLACCSPNLECGAGHCDYSSCRKGSAGSSEGKVHEGDSEGSGEAEEE